jgi:hypothetical protein
VHCIGWRHLTTIMAGSTIRTHCQLLIAVLLTVKNEQADLSRCFVSLASAERAILLDSQSRDRTNKIATSYGAEIVQCVPNLIASISYTTHTIRLGRFA